MRIKRDKILLDCCRKLELDGSQLLKLFIIMLGHPIGYRYEASGILVLRFSENPKVWLSHWRGWGSTIYTYERLDLNVNFRTFNMISCYVGDL